MEIFLIGFNCVDKNSFKIDLIVWKLFDGGGKFLCGGFKIDLIVWKLFDRG